MNEDENKESGKKDFLISFIISFVTAGILAGGIALFEVYITGGGASVELRTAWRYSADALGISGLLMLMGYILSFVASKGSFDILSYSIVAMFRSVFSYKKWKEDPERSFYHYKMKKNSKERKPILAILIVSLIFIAAGLICLAPYYVSLN